MYHGAEHKCINCIEHGMELNVENVLKSSRLHKRCGTSFLFFVIIVSADTADVCADGLSGSCGLWCVLLLVPVIAGVSFEIIRLAGRSDNPLVNALSKPGLALQRLTTREPDAAQAEVAIAAVEAVFDWRAYLRENFGYSGIPGLSGEPESHRRLPAGLDRPGGSGRSSLRECREFGRPHICRQRGSRRRRRRTPGSLLEYAANIDRSYYYHAHARGDEPEEDREGVPGPSEPPGRACEPAQYLTGEAWFYGRSFRVNPERADSRGRTRRCWWRRRLKRAMPGMRDAGSLYRQRLHSADDPQGSIGQRRGHRHFPGDALQDGGAEPEAPEGARGLDRERSV